MSLTVLPVRISFDGAHMSWIHTSYDARLRNKVRPDVEDHSEYRVNLPPASATTHPG